MPGAAQIENEKFQLFSLLMHVPATVVKSLARLAERGYDRMQLQIAAETTGADDYDRDSGLDDGAEVSPPLAACKYGVCEVLLTASARRVAASAMADDDGLEHNRLL